MTLIFHIAVVGIRQFPLETISILTRGFGRNLEGRLLRLFTIGYGDEVICPYSSVPAACSRRQSYMCSIGIST